MKVYWIECHVTGVRWSRNRWACPTSVPDLYISRANAERQVTDGKIGWHRHQWPEDGTYYVFAIVKEGELNET